jgi:hypothetical protein
VDHIKFDGNFSGLSLYIKEGSGTDPPSIKNKKRFEEDALVSKSFCCSGEKACFRQHAKTKAFTSYRKKTTMSIPRTSSSFVYSHLNPYLGLCPRLNFHNQKDDLGLRPRLNFHNHNDNSDFVLVFI